MNRYYFEYDNDELCYTLENIIERATELHINVFEAIPVSISESGVFWCKEYGEVGLVGNDSCGNLCKGYSPRNGKNGACRFYTHTYEKGKEFILNTKTKHLTTPQEGDSK